MLNKLYKKLHLLFAGTIMLIITLIIVMTAINAVNVERQNEHAQFQRTATLLIYQLEGTNSTKALTPILQTYENEFPLYALVNDTNGNILYESPQWERTAEKFLLDSINNQVSTKPLHPAQTTTQGGILEARNEAGHLFYSISANISTNEGLSYHCHFLSSAKSAYDILRPWLPLYLLIWCITSLSIALLTRFLLKKALRPTEQAIKSQQDFIAAASHELKSPLAVIIANTDILAEDMSLEQTAQQYIKNIDAECMRLNKLIKDLLLLASSDANTWTLYPQSINIDTILITLYETYEPLCRRAHIALNLRISEDCAPPCYTDPERLIQLLSILLDNAITHASSTPSIELSSNWDENTVSFTVIDHGSGIKNTEKDLIFNRFYKGDPSRSNKSHFGLGLSIAQEITTLLNGTLSVTDTLGGGATFTLRLPIQVKQKKHGS